MKTPCDVAREVALEHLAKIGTREGEDETPEAALLMMLTVAGYEDVCRAYMEAIIRLGSQNQE